MAISRLREPPLHNYLAYQSVIDSLNEDGFAVFGHDKGPPFEGARTEKLLRSSSQVNAALANAMVYPIDETLPPDIIRGNERGYADYVYLSFVLFGVQAISLYFFYFLLMAVSVGAFVVEFKDRTSALFLLSTYLAGLLFVMEFVFASGTQMLVLQNSRVFGIFTLLPMMHLLLVTIHQAPVTYLRVALIVVQSALMCFLLMSRMALFWQIVVVVAFGGIYAAGAFVRYRRSDELPKLIGSRLLPAAILVIVTVLNIVQVSSNEDVRYRKDSTGHLFWHNVLSGTLMVSEVLREKYVEEDKRKSLSDQLAYEAVMTDLRRRNDISPSIALLYQGKIYITPDKSWKEYEGLARNLVFKIAKSYPLEIVKGFVAKFDLQYRLYSEIKLSWSAAVLPIILFLLGGVLALGSNDMRPPNRRWQTSGLISVLIIGFALTPVLIFPGQTNIDVLLAYILVGAVGTFYCATDLTSELLKIHRNWKMKKAINDMS
ncbi:MAG: hypothetical protein Q7T44_01085 [Parvibaculum sp.]|nr:hypothetical protein [Parvibaculum sp.]